MSQTLQQLHKYIDMIKEWLPEWSDLKDYSEVSFQRLTGITNITYLVSYTGKNEKIIPKRLIGRVFGKSVEDIFVLRDIELLIYQSCAQHNLGPQIYGYQEDFRGEEYIDSVVMRSDQMRIKDYYSKVGLKIAQFHKQPLEDLGHHNLIERVLEKQLPIIEKVLEKASKKNLFSEKENEMIEEVLTLLDQENFDFIQKEMKKYQNSKVFSHNDMLANNILIGKDQKQTIWFIDFEYCALNLRTFDIANYFNESQIDYDFKQDPYFQVDNTEIPSSVVQDMLSYYAVQANCSEEIHVDQVDNTILQDEKNQKLVLELLEEYPFAQSLSHFYWALWGIFMSKTEEIQFDYIKFAHYRFQKYQEIKNAIIQKK